MELSTLSVSASQRPLKENFSAVNVTQVSLASPDCDQPENKMCCLSSAQAKPKNVSSLAGIHHCFVCKTSGDGVKRCMIPLCGKFYHAECIQTFSATQPHNKGFRCPLHVCLSCHITNPLNSNSKGKGISGIFYMEPSILQTCLLSEFPEHKKAAMRTSESSE